MYVLLSRLWMVIVDIVFWRNDSISELFYRNYSMNYEHCCSKIKQGRLSVVYYGTKSWVLVVICLKEMLN